MLQVVYVLTNPAMPGLVKIGKTYADDVGQRRAQLYTTGVPFPFDVAFACKVPNADEVERALHIAFAPSRVNPRREFFKIEPEQAIAVLELLHQKDDTAEIAASPTNIGAEEIRAAELYKARRPPLNFVEMGIPVGSELRFIDGEKTVTVTSGRLVRYGEEELSLTAVTRQVMGLTYDRQPTPFWTFNGKLLSEIYEETYERE